MQLAIALRLGAFPRYSRLSPTPAFEAPVLNLLSGPTDFSPNFNALYDIRAVAGNWIRLEIATNNIFTTALAGYDHQLTAPEIAANAVAITVTDRSEDLVFARLRHTTVQSPAPGTFVWSNVVEIALDHSTPSTSKLVRKDGTTPYLRKDGVSYVLAR